MTDDFSNANKKFFSLTQQQIDKSIAKIFEIYKLKVDLEYTKLDNRTGYFVRSIIVQNLFKSGRLTSNQLNTLNEIVGTFKVAP
jgi:hypothetical protein